MICRYNRRNPSSVICLLLPVFTTCSELKPTRKNRVVCLFAIDGRFFSLSLPSSSIPYKFRLALQEKWETTLGCFVTETSQRRRPIPSSRSRSLTWGRSKCCRQQVKIGQQQTSFLLIINGGTSSDSAKPAVFRFSDRVSLFWASNFDLDALAIGDSLTPLFTRNENSVTSWTSSTGAFIHLSTLKIRLFREDEITTAKKSDVFVVGGNETKAKSPRFFSVFI